MAWVLHIITPAHSFTVLNCTWQRSTFHWHSCIHVLIGRCPVHKWTLISSPRIKLYNPCFSSCFVSWMIVCMFRLRLEYSSYFCSVNRIINPIRVYIISSASSLVEFFPLVESDLIRITLNMQAISVRSYWNSLNCSIFKPLCIRGCPWWDSPDIASQFFRNCFKSFLSHHLTKSCNILWCHIYN
jgi:hypothetical protein